MANLDEVNLDEFEFDSPGGPVIKKAGRKMKRKPVVSFALYSEDRFEALFGRVVTGMTANGYFAEPWWSDPAEKPTVASLTADKAAYSLAKNAAHDGSKEKIATRKTLRDAATIDLQKLAKYVDLKSDGDVTMLESSGFDLTKVPAPHGTLPLEAPQDMRLKHGELPGMLLARCKSVKGAASYETQICAGDPGVPANWKPGAFTAGCARIELTGLTAGTLYHVRVRAINKNGPGAWSDEASLMAM